jgi:hypothetical protein
MDLHKYLHELYLEKKNLDRAIAALEAKQKRSVSPSRPARRRGRKSMSAEERQEVSRRMATYWAAKRAASASVEHKPASPAGELGSALGGEAASAASA